MVVIIVRKDWIGEIGKIVGDLLVAPHSGSLMLVYAAKTEMEYPFVFTELARTSEKASLSCPLIFLLMLFAGCSI